MQPTIKSYLLYILMLLVPAVGLAQAQKPTSKITGTIINTENKPVEFATVSLLRAKDSSIVKGALGNGAGIYTINNVPAGNYLIKTTAVGYVKGLSKAFIITNATGNYVVPAIAMLSSAQTLKTVNVQSTKPLIERKLDRTVMNVENSVLAAGNSVMDILERAPGVTVDKDDNISMNGKSGVTVMINDKLTYLSSSQLATLLRSTDGSNISSIELITNPSAKYDAAGNSGIINIKLKKNRQIGSSGSITVGAGYGNNWKSFQDLSLNHKQGKLNIYANLEHDDYRTARNLNIKRVVDSAGSLTYFNQYTGLNRDNYSNNYRVGADYDLTAKHTIGFVITGYDFSQDESNPSTTFVGRNTAVIDSFLNSTSESKLHFKNFAVNLNDRLKLDTLGQELAIDLDYSKFTNNTTSNYSTFSYKPNGQQSASPYYLRNLTPATINIRTAKADYTLPLNKTLKFETGVKFSDVKTDNNLIAQAKDASGNYVDDNSVNSNSNHFIYQEKINAGYVNLGKTWKNTSVQMGLRAEYTSSRGVLINKANPPVDTNYVNLFPSLFINHKLDKKNEVGLSYSRRIDRPDYDNLNPFVFYLDKFTYMQGNPFLKPQYTHSFELHYTWNQTINATLGYSHTHNVITEIILTDSIKKASYQTKMNLQVRNSYNLNINSPYTITKWWTGNANLNMFYLANKSAGLLGANLDRGHLAYVAKATQTLTFIKGYRLEIMGNYRSALETGIYDVRPQYSVDGGISHPFANKRANIKFSVNDIFNTRANNVNSMYQSVNLQIVQKGETRVSRLTFTYNFGNTKIKARNHQTGADEESNRVGKSN